MALVDSIYHLIHSSFALWLHPMDLKVQGCVVCRTFGRQHGAHQAPCKFRRKKKKNLSREHKNFKLSDAVCKRCWWTSATT